MVSVKVKYYDYDKMSDAVDEALKRFKRAVNKDGTLLELKKREFYIKPGEKKRKAKEAAVRAELKRMAKRGF